MRFARVVMGIVLAAGSIGTASAGVLGGTVDQLLGSADTTPEFGETVSLTAGPVPLPNVPLTICVGNDCVSTPSLGSVALEVAVAFDSAIGALPTITSVGCPAGQLGVALQVTTLAGSATVAADVTGTVAGMEYSKPVGPVTIDDDGRTVTISACST